MLYMADKGGNHEYSPMDTPQWISEGLTMISNIFIDEKRHKDSENKWRAVKGF